MGYSSALAWAIHLLSYVIAILKYRCRSVLMQVRFTSFVMK